LRKLGEVIDACLVKLPVEFFGKLESPPGVEEIEGANGRMGFFVVMPQHALLFYSVTAKTR